MYVKERQSRIRLFIIGLWKFFQTCRFLWEFSVRGHICMSTYICECSVSKGQSIFGSFMRKHIYVRADAITESNGLFTRDEGLCPSSTVLIHFWEICCFGFLNLPNFGRFSYPPTPFPTCVNKYNELKT